MSDDRSVPVDGEEEKRLVIKLKARTPVETSRGTLFVRHFSLSDYSALSQQLEESTLDVPAIGKDVLLRLTTKTSDEEDKAKLDPIVLDALTDADRLALCGAVAQAYNLALSAGGRPGMACA